MPFPHWITRAALPCALPALLCGAHPAPAGAQVLVLKHIAPGRVLDYFRLARGDRGGLPPGVRRITVRPQDNALDVDATPDGFSLVREIADNLDVVPRRVSLTVSFARASDTQAAALGAPLPPGDGPGASPSLVPAALGTASVRGLPPAGLATTLNNVSATLSLPAPGVRSVTLTLTPRVNADDSVTLTVRGQVAEEFDGAVGPGGATGGDRTVALETTRTTRAGAPVVLADRLFSPSGPGGGPANTLLIVVTPALLAPEDAPAAPGN